MTGLRGRIRRLFHLGFWGPDPEQGVDWEIEHHIAERADELEAEGLSRPEALKEARRQFGDVEAVRREMAAGDRGEARRRRLSLWLETVWQDVRYGARGMLRHGGFSVGLVATMGLGIGAMVAVFGVVDALLLRPLPYTEPAEVVEVRASAPGSDFPMGFLPVDAVLEWMERDRAFDGMFPHQRWNALFTGGAEPQTVVAHRVGSSFEEVLGVRPSVGRGLLPEDVLPGAAPVALISHDFWRSAFGGDPEIVGRQVLLNGTSHTVVGIMPRGFKFPVYSHTEFWLPLVLVADRSDGERGPPGRVELIARVPDGAMDRATAASSGLAAGLFEGRPGLDSADVALLPLESRRGGGDQLQRAVWLLFGAVGLILLVAAVNGSNLLLVRSAGRARELAVRLALGASRARVMRQLLTETLGLALLSGAVAVFIALVAVRGIQGILPDSLVFWLPHALAIEERAVTFAFVIAVGAGLVLGLVPALASTRPARAAARDGLTPYAAGTPGRSRLRHGLVVGEVAITIVLLVGAGLLLNSFLRLAAVDVGVDTENLAFLHLPLSSRAQPDSVQRASFLPRLEERVRGMPGVTAATATGNLPAGGFKTPTALQVEGQPEAGGDPDFLPIASVSPEFFDVMGARLLAGRSFLSDETYADNVAIIDDDLARHLWRGGNAVGGRFRVRANEPWLTVVGVVADLQLEERGHGDFEVLYPFDATAASGYVTVAFRTAGDPTRLFKAVRAAVHELAPNQPVREVVLADTAYGRAIDLPRFLVVLVGGLGAFALVLAAVGLFGVLACDVVQRRREIGVRMAVGASSDVIRKDVVGRGLLLAGMGAAIGIAAAVAMGRLMAGLLFDLEPTDPATLAAVVATMIVTAAAASYIPARRATRIDPAEVIRAE